MLPYISSGKYYVSGGADKVIKIWDYDLGLCTFQGLGHSGAVTKVTYCIIKRN